MGYSKPSASRAVNLLKNGGYITMDKDNLISLTESGMEIAQKIFERHTLIANLLIRLGVSEKTAAEDACKLEHSISDESFEAIRRYMEHHL